LRRGSPFERTPTLFHIDHRLLCCTVTQNFCTYSQAESRVVIAKAEGFCFAALNIIHILLEKKSCLKQVRPRPVNNSGIPIEEYREPVCNDERTSRKRRMNLNGPRLDLGRILDAKVPSEPLHNLQGVGNLETLQRVRRPELWHYPR